MPSEKLRGLQNLIGELTMRTLIIVLALLAFSGCAVTPEERLASAREFCSEVGYTPDTDAHRDCIVATVNADKVAEATAAAAAVYPVVIPPLPPVNTLPPIGTF